MRTIKVEMIIEYGYKCGRSMAIDSRKLVDVLDSTVDHLENSFNDFDVVGYNINFIKSEVEK